MDSTRFDDLTKALATATSRRQALQRIGGILGGTALAGLFPGLALASNSACTTFCNAVFGAETQAAGTCISDAAHGKGLCHSCGSANPSSICCTRNASGFCSSYSATLPCSCDSTKCLTCDTTHGTCVSTGVACGSACCSGSTPNCCSNTCTNTQSDVNNCGQCGHGCASGEMCVNGACT